MQSALISTLAPTYNSSGLESGYSIIQLVPLGDDFPVNSDFFWADAPDLATSQTYYYETSSSTVVALPRYYSTVPLVNSLGVEVSPAGTEFTASPGLILPASITTLTPPAPPEEGQTLYFYGGAWVISSFDPSLPLPQAKSTLISAVTQNGATAVNTELGLYSNVQQIEAGSVLTLETLTYPGTTIGEYQTYIDGQVATSTATINAATSTEDLYTFNPANVPYTPESFGIINIGRGDGIGGPEDLNLSYLVELNSVSLTPSQTSLFIPGTSTTVAYDSGLPSPYMFNATFGAFNPGDYTLQIRVTATSQVIATIVVPFGANQDISF